MEVNWLTVLNTAIKVWIKGTLRGREERGVEANFFVFLFLIFFLITCQVCIIVIYQAVCFLPIEIVFREYQSLGSSFFHPSFPLTFQPFIPPTLPSTVSFLSYPIPTLLLFSWFHPPTMGVKITFQLEHFMLQSTSWCNLFLQKWKHQAAFAALHVCKSEQWCTPSETSETMCLDCLDTI